MRCAILRLTSRGVSPAEPRRARDSVETQAMISRRAPSPAGLQDSRAEGGAQDGHLGGGVQKGIFAGFNFMEHIRHRRGGGGGSGAEEGRNGKVPGLSEPGGPAGNPHVGRAAAPTRGGEREGEPSGSEKVPPGSGAKGEQEARLLELRETEVYSATAEQTIHLRLRNIERGRTSGRGSRRRGRRLSRHPKSACGGGAAWKCGREGRGYGCRGRQE